MRRGYLCTDNLRPFQVDKTAKLDYLNYIVPVQVLGALVSLNICYGFNGLNGPEPEIIARPGFYWIALTVAAGFYSDHGHRVPLDRPGLHP